MSKPRKTKRKIGFFRAQERGAYFMISLFAGLGLLLLVSALHMSLTGDEEAYYTKSAISGTGRSTYGPAFLYIIGGCMLAFAVFLRWPTGTKKQ